MKIQPVIESLIQMNQTWILRDIEIQLMNKFRIRRFSTLYYFILLCSCSLSVSGAEPDQNELLKQQIEQAWQVTWTRFYRPETHLFYDYLSSYEPGKELGHLPTAAEVQRQFPNPCGYSTGMEDGMIARSVLKMGKASTSTPPAINTHIVYTACGGIITARSAMRKRNRRSVRSCLRSPTG